jgi:hypothetical protein
MPKLRSIQFGTGRVLTLSPGSLRLTADPAQLQSGDFLVVFHGDQWFLNGYPFTSAQIEYGTFHFEDMGHCSPTFGPIERVRMEKGILCAGSDMLARLEGRRWFVPVLGCAWATAVVN